MQLAVLVAIMALKMPPEETCLSIGKVHMCRFRANVVG